MVLERERPQLFLLDGTAMAYRSHFAFIRSPLVNSSGENTSAVYGFALSLLAILEGHQPEYLAVVFDPRPPTFRHELYPEYKATREKMPDELGLQLPWIDEMLDALGIRRLQISGFEADDVIGTLARQGADEYGLDVFMVTGDKDFLQLVGPRIKVLTFTRAGEDAEIIGPESVEGKIGVPAERVVDLLGLAGDSSDNVPGIPKVGPKTAIKLLEQFGSLEAVLDGAERISAKGVRERVVEHADLARLSRELVTIRTDVPLGGVSIDQLRPGEISQPEIRDLFTRMEFTSLLNRVCPSGGEPEVEVRYLTVDSETRFQELLQRLDGCDELAVDLETTSLDPFVAEIVGLSFSFRPKEAFYLPLNLSPEEADLPEPSRLLEALKPRLECEKIRKVGQNIKYDMIVLAQNGIRLGGMSFDTMIASYVLNPGRRQHNLDSLSLEYLNHQNIPISDLIGKGKNLLTFDHVPIPRATEYACEDADMTLRLKEVFEPMIGAGGFEKLYHELEMRLVHVLIRMQQNGVAVDVETLAGLSGRMGAQRKSLEGEIFELAGEEFNVNSPKQLAHILFERMKIHEEMGIKRIKKTKSGFSTDVTVLQQLSAHPLPKKLLEYRHLTKLKNTYVDVLPGLVNPRTGRIHTSYNQAVAATGRLSSSDPNLQNIPVRTATGRDIRRAFVPRPEGWKLISADYSQVELRILAHLSQDEGLVTAFRTGDDVHRRTAAEMFGVAPGEVTAEQRSRAKVINFGVIYGMGPVRLAREFEVSMKEARLFIEEYFVKYPGIKRFVDQSLEEARERGEVSTLLGRRRPLPDIVSTDPRVRAAAENMAVNTPIQGTAADIIKKAMIEIHTELEQRGLSTRMIMQVHDELVFESPPGEVELISELAVEIMSSTVSFSVPLVVDVGVGDNWVAAH